MPDSGSGSSRVGPSCETDRLAFCVILDGQAVGVAEFGFYVHVVTQGRELGPDRLWYAAFGRDPVRFNEADAWCGDRLLNVHVKVYEVHQHLRSRLRDVVTTLDPYSDNGFPFTHDEGRADPDEPVAAGEDVQRVSFRLKGGVRDGVVEPDPGSFRHHPAAEHVAYGLRGAYYVPLVVRHYKVGGVFLLVGNVGRRRARGRCRLGAYLRGFFGPVLL